MNAAEAGDEAPRGGPLRSAVRALVVALVRLYFPAREVSGASKAPAAGPVVFVANHNNGLLDPIVLRLAAGRPVRFLAKSTLFANPFGRIAMEAFGAIPVYRAQDAAGAARPTNETTFAICRAALAHGEGIALFPEGTSHSDPRMKPMKTGAARIVLSAEAEYEGLGLRVVPAALVYERKAAFRSGVLVVFGAPIEVAPRLAAYRAGEWEAVEALTEDVRHALEALVLEADTRELLAGVVRVSAFVAPTAEAARDPAALHDRARVLLRAYAVLRARDPAKLEAIVGEARRYMDTLRELGVDDPWAVEVGRVRPWPALRTALTLLALAPFAALGAVAGWVPYRAVGLVAPHVSRHDDVAGTIKLVGGLLFLPAAWLIEAVVVGRRFGAAAGAAWFALAPACGYAALRFEERARVAMEALSHGWLRRGRPADARAVGERRRALATAVEAGLREVDASA